MYGFALQDEFIREALGDFPAPAETREVTEKYLPLPDSTILRGFFDSIVTYIKQNEELDPQLVRLKTREALLGILQARPDYWSVFAEFSTPQRADLVAFMEHNYPFNISLDRLARMSGRSLSTFHREFKTTFGDSPHRWIMNKRLKKARELLLLTSLRPSDIYLDLGFEDLAHFSRSFKKAFGKSPTDFKSAMA
ncbi:MAG: helix-turn-helix transcriptional regulator [Lewinella sp.]|nr:helix-turn-helix transcriptional regulator [Lewinella sp.]